MTQGFLEIFGLHLRSKALIPQTHRLLCQQGNFNGQVHETPRKLIMRH